jgi:Protein of unknown function (DUF3102)
VVGGALRNAAHAIKNIQRSAIYDLGRHLLDAKKLLEHGQFLRWAAAELGMKSRTAQRAMGAARFMEGKSDTVTLLPAAAIYALSAPSAPAAARDAIVAELENSTPLPVHEINNRLDSGRAGEREIQQELARAQSKEQRLTRAEAKDLVAKQQAERKAVAEKNRLLRDALRRDSKVVRSTTRRLAGLVGRRAGIAQPCGDQTGGAGFYPPLWSRRA